MTPFARVVAIAALPLLIATMPSLAAGRTMADVLAASKPSDWRPLDPNNTLYMDLESGRVVIELQPDFAPKHAANLRALTRAKYFDGLAITRSQDNYVVQWGEADAKKPMGQAKKALAPEFTRPAAGLNFTALPDPDTYAAQTGFVNGFPAARDSATGSAWMVHCYGVVGAGRDNDVNTGSGAELYVITGNAPRQLDRNITVVGRVLQGMDLLSTMPRGKGAMGFYQKPEERTPITRIRLAADVPEAERTRLQVLRTDTQTFTDLVESRRNRQDEWYKVPAGRIDVCNVPLPVRQEQR
ncbi:peptidyl-prolyl cis-trans isomerase [Steroidobacter agaridevorans]|uniref:peptidylprolyl isomerase n=2 Tax=Steroidobacter agaridevorans TaxID=2695856 RepID=A0A829Y5Y8_9GAMM|nr:peptidylprolyl isomerase [Steroidobacter agaridevorans]GFE78042.1 peptidyl-prolyl cis-trans isomerase [Steroidobacter agaridevorans]GFE91101.1 peptidyl-prolyl cis-trans isomerase [Steroidobacter agaridevorans]